MSDYIKRENAMRAVWGCVRDTGIDEAPFEYAEGLLEDVPSEDVAPVRHEDDGTLWVTVADCEKVGRVIIKNEQGHFCRVFYMGDGDEEPVRHGRWEEVQFRTIPYNRIEKAKKCSECGKKKDKYVTWHFCPNCGAKMDEGGNDGINN